MLLGYNEELAKTSSVARSCRTTPIPTFPGFPAEALTFFRQLKRNSNREWFEARKPVFEEKVRAPMVAFVEALNAELATLALDRVTEPKKAI